MPPPDDTAAAPLAKEKYRQFINELREILTLSMEQPLTESHVDVLLQNSDALLTVLRQHRQKRALPAYNVKFPDNATPADRCNDLMPYSPVAGEFNPIAPPLRFHQNGDEMIGVVTLDNTYEGPPGAIHGAFVAAIHDQMLANANAMSGTAGPTAYLKVNYIKPTPLHVPLTFRAWKAEQNGRKVLMRGECIANGEVVTDCEALFVQFMPKGVAEAIKE